MPRSPISGSSNPRAANSSDVRTLADRTSVLCGAGRQALDRTPRFGTAAHAPAQLPLFCGTFRVPLLGLQRGGPQRNGMA
jgi:hypothetical protein